ncbi:MAG: corrinoid protein [Desulfosalsimonadaceae bacterium]
MAEDLGKVAESLVAGKVDEVSQMVRDALDAGTDPEEVLNKGLIAGMDVVGQRFKVGDMFIPEVLRSAKAMSAGMEHLRPVLAEGGSKSSAILVVGTVEGDLHDIGKNLVGMMFEGAGFKVVNIGIDLKPEVFVDAVKEHKPNLLGMSALLTTTMPKMGETINALKEAGVRDQVKIMVGGAPVTEEYAKEIGADMYGANAASSVDKARAELGI